VGEFLVALFLGFFGLLAALALGAQIYGLTGRHERRGRGPAATGGPTRRRR
jgi:hypothetical protein